MGPQGAGLVKPVSAMLPHGPQWPKGSGGLYTYSGTDLKSRSLAISTRKHFLCRHYGFSLTQTACPNNLCISEWTFPNIRHSWFFIQTKYHQDQNLRAKHHCREKWLSLQFPGNLERPFPCYDITIWLGILKGSKATGWKMSAPLTSPATSPRSNHPHRSLGSPPRRAFLHIYQFVLYPEEGISYRVWALHLKQLINLRKSFLCAGISV